MTCIDYFGIPVHTSECDQAQVSGIRSYRMCPEFECDGNWKVELKAWTPCPKSCTKVLENGVHTIHFQETMKHALLCRYYCSRYS